MDKRTRRRTQRIPSCLGVSWIRRGTPQPAVAADINEHGLFIRTDLDAQPGELLQVIIELPDGPLPALVTARFVGVSESGRGIGAELFVLGDGERRRWSQHYRAQKRALGSAAVEPARQSA